MAKITDLSDMYKGYLTVRAATRSIRKRYGCHRKMTLPDGQSHERMMLTASPPSGGDAASLPRDSRRAQNTHLRENKLTYKKLSD
jgi:hypothetical protein